MLSGLTGGKLFRVIPLIVEVIERSKESAPSMINALQTPGVSIRHHGRDVPHYPAIMNLVFAGTEETEGSAITPTEAGFLL